MSRLNRDVLNGRQPPGPAAKAVLSQLAGTNNGLRGIKGRLVSSPGRFIPTQCAAQTAARRSSSLPDAPPLLH
ncbi:MAG: hypothetical protein KDJ52_31480, partial [Anaerolineae bacterium]|nr:hypothetical protein [Anaerolineae bacterium]